MDIVTDRSCQMLSTRRAVAEDMVGQIYPSMQRPARDFTDDGLAVLGSFAVALMIDEERIEYCMGSDWSGDIWRLSSHYSAACINVLMLPRQR